LVITSGNGISKRRGNEGTDVTVLRLADFKNAVRVRGNERKITLSDKEQEKYCLANGDLLAIRVNGSVDLAGRFILYEEDLKEAYCDHFIKFSVDTERLLPKYLAFVANEGEGREYLKQSLSTSAGQNTINQKSIKNMIIDLPTIQEQTEIVSRIEQLFTFADQIEQRVKDAQSRVNHLTQSILAKAFRGELTAEWREQNPDLISGENSAEALLNRIKAQRQSTPLKTRTRKKRA
jgi:type I restriction enzyme S subunit